MRIKLPKTPFQISLTLHGSAFLLLICGSLFQGCMEPEEEFVFELVPLPSVEAPSVQSAAPSPKPPEPVQLPEPEPTFSQIEPLRDRPVVEQPRPEPVPQPRPEPAPVTPRETPRPPPEPERPQPMSIEEFRKLHGRPQTPSRPQPQRQPTRIDVPTINTNQITQSLQNAASQAATAPASSDMAAEMSAYDDRLQRFINGLMPNRSYTAIESRVIVELRFDGNGRVLGYRIIQRSGFAEFDRDVENVFKGLKNVPAPPNRKRGSRTIPFRVGLGR